MIALTFHWIHLLITQISVLTGITPASYSMSLKTIDNENDHEVIDQPDCPCFVDDSENVITVEHPQPHQRLWLYHVYAGDCDKDAISSNKTLSKLCLSYYYNFPSLQ